MGVLKDFDVKALENVHIGELIMLRRNSVNVFCICEDKVPHKAHLICLGHIPDSDEQTEVSIPRHAFYMRYSTADTYCISFGNDWYVELIRGPESFAKNIDAQNVFGTINVWRDKATIYTNTFSGSGLQPAHYSLELAHHEEPEDIAVPIHRWKIWLSEADRMRPGSSPLVVFRDGELHAPGFND